jgi:predicted O-linked N-acetylglucosamine transferase (SPINDLY family)
VPHDVEALIQEAHALYDRGQPAAALAGYRKALAVQAANDPGRFKLFVAIGNCLELEGDARGAVEAYEAALALEPRCAPAHWNLRDLHARLGNTAAAERHAAALAALEAGPALALRELFAIPVLPPDTRTVADWRSRRHAELTAFAAQATGQVALPESEVNATPLYLAYLGIAERDLACAMSAALRRVYPARTTVVAPPRRARIRVAFVSTLFRNHSIGRLYRGIIEGLDRARFEVGVFSIDHVDDETARRITGCADHRVLLSRHVPDAVAAIDAWQPDVVYYPELGLDPVTWCLAHWRLAPLQCMSYGHPATSGVDTIDVFLSSTALDGPEAADHYAERLVRLPGFYMPLYEPPGFADSGADFTRFGVPAGRRVYFCPQTLIKFHPDFDATLASLLARDPEAVLVLIEGPEPSWRAALAQRLARSLGPAFARVHFIPTLVTADYATLLKRADCVLDTFQFGAGISALEAIGAGVPMVTLEGRFFRGRQAAVCARLLGVEACIAKTPAEYVDIAWRMANEPRWRAELAERVAANAGRAFGQRAALTALEDFLVEEVARRRSL